MRSNKSSQLAPPWGTQSIWKEAKRSIDKLFQRHAGKLSSAVTLASVVRVWKRRLYGRSLDAA